jgi:N utilization substance protein A
VKLSLVIEELVQERGLDRSTLSEVVSEGMLAAYKKKYPHLDIYAQYNKKTDEIDITINKTVVSTVNDEQTEISLRKARAVNENVSVGDMITLPLKEPIGRIEILKAKQFIAQKIRNIEALAVYQEFKSKENTLVHGVVHKCERNGITVKLQDDTLAFLPKSLASPGYTCQVGFPIRALLKEVYTEPRNENQLILDRVSSEFLKQLFELEVPEIYEKLVEIKRIVRSPGYKSKVLVASYDQNIDPVGTCVGVGGSRIKPILRELGSEKIDIIADTASEERLITESLKPARVNGVDITDDYKATVWVDEDQRAVAIGKMGQNISLASKLTGYDIQLACSKDISSNDVDVDMSFEDDDQQD